MMPKKKTTEEKQYSYEELLRGIRTHIDEAYGGVSKFLQHEDYTGKCGFVESERSKIFSYLSISKDGTFSASRTKSFPMVQKLYKVLLDIDLTSKIVVSREQVISCNSAKIDKLFAEAS